MFSAMAALSPILIHLSLGGYLTDSMSFLSVIMNMGVQGSLVYCSSGVFF